MISTNLIDLISHQITNNVIGILNSNNNRFSGNLSNYNNNANNNNDIFRIKKQNKLSKKNLSESIEKNDNNFKKERIQMSLNRRKENLNKFLFNYRYKKNLLTLLRIKKKNIYRLKFLRKILLKN